MNVEYTPNQVLMSQQAKIFQSTSTARPEVPYSYMNLNFGHENQINSMRKSYPEPLKISQDADIEYFSSSVFQRRASSSSYGMYSKQAFGQVSRTRNMEMDRYSPRKGSK